MNSVIIFGHGRSGTNWLLDIFDKSQITFCANERNNLSRSALSEIPNGTVDYGQYQGLENRWEEVLEKTRSRFGERDRTGVKKTYFGSGVRGQLLKLIKGRKRLRHSLCLLNSAFTNEEWEIPLIAIKKSEFLNSVLVLKVNKAPALANWIVTEHPGTIAIHIVRHPCGMLNSWKNRFYASHDDDLLKTGSRNRLSVVLKMARWLHPPTRDGISNCLSSPNPSITELELWYWRYSNEAIMECGDGKDNYARVIYEDLVTNPVVIAKSLFQKVGLDFSDQIRASLERGVGQSTGISNKWLEELPESEIRVAKDILSGSTLQNLWT